MTSADCLALLEAQQRRIARAKALVGAEAFERMKASGRSSFGPFAMASSYYDRLRKLSDQFDAAFAERNNANSYTWAFLGDYNPGELDWLYEDQSLRYGSRSPRCALLRRRLAGRGIAA